MVFATAGGAGSYTAGRWRVENCWLAWICSGRPLGGRNIKSPLLPACLDTVGQYETITSMERNSGPIFHRGILRVIYSLGIAWDYLVNFSSIDFQTALLGDCADIRHDDCYWWSRVWSRLRKKRISETNGRNKRQNELLPKLRL